MDMFTRNSCCVCGRVTRAHTHTHSFSLRHTVQLSGDTSGSHRPSSFQLGVLEGSWGVTALIKRFGGECGCIFDFSFASERIQMCLFSCLCVQAGARVCMPVLVYVIGGSVSVSSGEGVGWMRQWGE